MSLLNVIKLQKINSDNGLKKKKNTGKKFKEFWEIGYLNQIISIYIIVAECKSIFSKFKNK